MPPGEVSQSSKIVVLFCSSLIMKSRIVKLNCYAVVGPPPPPPTLTPYSDPRAGDLDVV